MEIRVGLDVDGILASFFEIYEAAIRRLTGRDLFPPRAEFEPPPVWNWPEFYGYTSEEIGRVWEYIKRRGDFWLAAKPFPDAERLFLSAFDASVAVYFITDRPGPEAKYYTEAWLSGVGLRVHTPTVLVSRGPKGLLARGLGLTHFVEDKLENALSVAQESPSTWSYLLDRPYNRPAGGALFMPPPNLIRVKDYDDLLRRLFREGE